jgi:cytochrome P450
MEINPVSPAQPSPDWEPLEELFPEGPRSPQWFEENARLQSRCPVAYSDKFGGFYSLFKYQDVTAAALDYQHFPSGQVFVRIPSMRISPGQLNPPEHTAYRRMLNKYFTRDRIEALAPLMRQYAGEALVPMIERGHGDAAREFCQIIPARALAVLMNLGDDAYRELLEEFKRFDETGWNPDEVNGIIFVVFSSHIAKLIAERRQRPLNPEQDLLSGAMAMEVDGHLLTDEEVVAVGVSMIGAGHGTTADSLSNIVYRLATDPALQARLRRDPELIPSAIEEFLRLDAPVPELARRTAADVEMSGRTIPAGSLVALQFAAANYDPDVFEHPEACIVDRTPNRHLAFGHGPHKCVGAPLARLELNTTVTELLARTRNFTLNGCAEVVPGLILRGYSSLPLRFVGA